MCIRDSLYATVLDKWIEDPDDFDIPPDWDKKGRVQINLSDGKNYLSNEKIKVGDSVVVNLKEKRIIGVLPFKEKCKVLFVSGKHIGEVGIVEKIDRVVEVKVEDKKINSKKENLMVIK